LPDDEREILPVGLFCRSPWGSAPSPVAKAGNTEDAGVREPSGSGFEDEIVAWQDAVDEFNPNRGSGKRACLKLNTAGEQGPLPGGITEVGLRCLQGRF